MKTSDHLSQKHKEWSPSPEAQMLIFWRIMHLYMSRYGSIPVGQMLVDLTTIVLNELGRPPTVTDLCDATGLPKSSISRYVSAQMSRDMASEVIDPQDRRRRKLVPTEKGKDERKWQVKQVRKIIEDVYKLDEMSRDGKQAIDPEAEFERMKQSNENRPEMVGRKRKKRRTAA